MYTRTLVPADGSRPVEEAAHAAVALAKSTGGSIVGFHALPSYSEMAYKTVAISPGWVSEEKFNKLNKQNARKYLRAIETIAKAAGVEYESYTLTRAHPALAIVEAATDKQCDLICIGSHGRGGLAQVFLGSVTMKVLSMCSIPVLVHRVSVPRSRAKSAPERPRCAAWPRRIRCGAMAAPTALPQSR